MKDDGLTPAERSEKRRILRQLRKVGVDVAPLLGMIVDYVRIPARLAQLVRKERELEGDPRQDAVTRQIHVVQDQRRKIAKQIFAGGGNGANGNGNADDRPLTEAEIAEARRYLQADEEWRPLFWGGIADPMTRAILKQSLLDKYERAHWGPCLFRTLDLEIDYWLDLQDSHRKAHSRCDLPLHIRFALAERESV